MRKIFRQTVVGTVLAVFLAFGAAPAAETAAEGERWAVIIGINDYQDLGKLTTARNDAKALAQVLVESGGFAENRVILLTDDAADPQNRPTLAAMRKRIENTATFTEPQDTLLVFFSGHGIVREGHGYLVPMDGDARNAVSLDWVKDVLSKARAKSKVLILDACHAGSAAKGVGGIAPSLVAGAGGIVMLLSSAADQVSYPDEATGLSVFSKHLVEGLSGAADTDGDKAVTFAEVAAYVNRRLKDWYVETGKVQTPVTLPEPPPEAVLARITSGVRRPLRLPSELRGDVVAHRQIPTEMAADGHVVKVDKLGSDAYADIGKKDGVLLGMPFSVFSPTELGKEDPQPKASARIVRIMDDASELRITLQGNEPVVAGDVLYNPVYDRGRRLRFMMVGKMDMDGDGADDSGSLRAMIQELGGRLDTELSVQTDYLILGYEPKLGPAPGPDAGPMERQLYEEARAAFIAYSTAVDKAKDFSVLILSLNRFLSLMGLAGGD